MLEIKIVKPGTPVPHYKTKGAAAFDLTNQSGKAIRIPTHGIELIPTGIAVKIPKGFYGSVSPRSGKALEGLTFVNSPGIIDEDYRGEISLITTNVSVPWVYIQPGERIAQMVILPYVREDLVLVDEFSPDTDNDRTGGFGSTGAV